MVRAEQKGGEIRHYLGNIMQENVNNEVMLQWLKIQPLKKEMERILLAIKARIDKIQKDDKCCLSKHVQFCNKQNWWEH